jgi:uncharacterized coiled-coil protein SlyX
MAAACSSKGEMAASAGQGGYEESYARAAAYGEEWTGTTFAPDSNLTGMNDATDGTRKLAVTANLRVRLSDLEKGEADLNGILAAYNAYSSSTSAQENWRRYTIRVPSDAYTACFADLKNMGKILSYSEETEDVTERYYDLESRLATQRELIKTFQAYLGKAATIDDIMTVERRIAELQSEIDNTGSQFRALSRRIDYAAIELELRGPESTRSYSKPAIGELVARLFRTFTDYASGVVLVLLGIVIYGVPSVLIVALLYWLLLGKIGLLKKLWRIAGEKKR